MKTVRKIIEIDEGKCNGCGQCVPACAEGALSIVDGKAKLVSDVYCDGLGACLGECPQDAIRLIDREAEEFNEEEVKKYLKEKEQAEKGLDTIACGCPSSHIKMLKPLGAATGQSALQSGASCSSGRSALSQWPIQIRLIPASAMFLKGAHLLVAADCTPAAYPDFHKDFLQGRILMIGCPKFDDAEDYVQKFAAIFKEADIKSVTVLSMEVPCCSKLPVIVRKGMELAGKGVPMEDVVIDVRGGILKRTKIAA